MAAGSILSRGKRWLGGLASASALVLVTGAMTLAPEAVRDQDEREVWRDLAGAYLETAAETGWDTAPAALEFASFTVEPDERFGARITARALDDLRSFDTSHLDAARAAARERRCLAEAIFYEARSERFAGQAAVAEVVLNRVRHRAYPDSVCGVVYQGSERTTGCQFTFTCDGSLEREPYGRTWTKAQLVAEHALMGFAQPVTRRATHYHTTEVNPIWNQSLVRTRRIGAHIFYRFPNRSERQLLIAEREA
ncbi:MAG: cell wall hydrolase [Oceanicaulis sp.]